MAARWGVALFPARLGVVLGVDAELLREREVDALVERPLSALDAVMARCS
jgi:hypothetical protein